MKVDYLKISNYRNLDEIKIEFSEDICFLIGENNLGKSNVLHALYNIFLTKKFDIEDFYDESRPLSFEVRLFIEDAELGLFDDFTDPYNPNFISFYVEQLDGDSQLTYKHIQTGQSLSYSNIKEMLIIDYDSIHNPKNEISFQKSKGAASLLNFLIKKYVSENNVSYLNSRKLKSVEVYINKNINKIIPKSKYNLYAATYSDNIELLSSIFNFYDNNGVDISKIGYGIQYITLIILSIFDKIISFIKRKKNIPNISALLLLDEPEIHLHPHMQRSLIIDLQKICKGEDENFNELLKKLFNVDKFKAQLIISTHSPNIINDEYKNLCRFYMASNGKTNVVSLKNFELDIQENKQLHIQYYYVKEAMFARGALVFEGDSEYWSFPGFAEKMNIDFDSLGISLIKANGADSVIPLMKLLNALKINTVGIVDKDKKSNKLIYDNVFFTTQQCFESEIVATLIKKNNIELLQQIICDNDVGLNIIIQKGAIIKTNKKYKFKVDITSDVKISTLSNPSLKNLYFLAYVTWFSSKKGAYFSKYLANVLSCNDIPYCYKNVINKIVKLVKQGY